MLKFGISINFNGRFKSHKGTFKNFVLIDLYVIHQCNKAENMIKEFYCNNNLIKKTNINSKNQTEIICCHSLHDLTGIIFQFEQIYNAIRNDDIDYLTSQNAILTDKLKNNDKIMMLLSVNNSKYTELKDKCANLENECKEIKNNLSQITQILLTLNDKIVYMS